MLDAVILARCFGLLVSIFQWLITIAEFLVMPNMGKLMEEHGGLTTGI